MTNHARLIDQEGATESHTGFWVFDIISFADLMLDVGDQRVLNRPNAAIGDLGVSPGIMSKLGIDGDTNDLDAALLKLLKAVVKGNQFGWADKGKVERIEKDNRGLPLDTAAQVEVIDDLTIASHGGCGEIRC